MPNLNVTVGVPAETETPKTEIVKAEQIISYYNEILNDIREDRDEVNEVIKNFMEMVINEGDPSQASKEALVNLIKIKSETADKKTRVMDLLLRAFTRDRSIPGYIAAHQNNYYVGSKKTRGLLESLEAEEKNDKS